MYLFYTHGLGGTLRAQPEIEEVFTPLGYTVIRVEVPRHGSLAELATQLATMTFGDLCLIGKEALIRYAVPFLQNTPVLFKDRVRQWFFTLLHS